MKRFIEGEARKLRGCRSVWTITLPKKIRCEWSTFSSMSSTWEYLELKVLILVQRGVLPTIRQYC